MLHLYHRLRNLPHPAPTRTATNAVEKEEIFEQIQHHWEPNTFSNVIRESISPVLWPTMARFLRHLDPPHRNPTPLWGLQPQWEGQLIHKSSICRPKHMHNSPALLLSVSRCWIWGKVPKFWLVAVRFEGVASLSNRPSKIRAPIPRDLR